MNTELKLLIKAVRHQPGQTSTLVVLTAENSSNSHYSYFSLLPSTFLLAVTKTVISLALGLFTVIWKY